MPCSLGIATRRGWSTRPGRHAADQPCRSQLERLELLQVRARRRLIAPQRREPHVMALRASKAAPPCGCAQQACVTLVCQTQARLGAWRLTRFNPHFSSARPCSSASARSDENVSRNSTGMSAEPRAACASARRTRLEARRDARASASASAAVITATRVAHVSISSSALRRPRRRRRRSRRARARIARRSAAVTGAAAIVALPSRTALRSPRPRREVSGGSMTMKLPGAAV